MLDKIANKIAVESDKDEEIILYGLTILTNSILAYLLLYIISFVFGWSKIALTAALTSSIFRIFSGGLHAKTNLRCIINTAVIFNVLAFITKFLAGLKTQISIVSILVFIGTLCLIFIIFLSPKDVPEKPINNSVQRIILKVISVSLGVLWIIIVFLYTSVLTKEYFIASALGYVWQVLTLTNVLKKFL